jgi:hypothetical protein
MLRVCQFDRLDEKVFSHQYEKKKVQHINCEGMLAFLLNSFLIISYVIICLATFETTRHQAPRIDRSAGSVESMLMLVLASFMTLMMH